MKRKNKGFTLIELLAVIVILGLLMAIAIPSVTKYITESRKKTLATTLGNYIGALVNDVNDLEYTFTGTNTIYAVPIECIALERGGTNPFGHWYQANDSYFAYVLVQYDDSVSKYIYGFTFKDSAGYGLYPTIQGNLDEKGSQVKTGYTLNKPVTGDLTSLTTLAKWQESGFKVDSSTYLQVLEATSENQTGDGINTCTLQQKGDNYAQVEEEKENEDNVAIDTPLYFGKHYILNDEDMSISYVFYEDGSINAYVECYLLESLPAGSLEYKNNQILMMGELMGTISSDKKILEFTDGSGDRMVLDPSISCEGYTDLPMLVVRSEINSIFSTANIDVDKIKTIILSNSINVPSGVTTYDLSSGKNGKVVAFIKQNTTNSNYIDLYIQGDGELYAPVYSTALFSEMSSLTEIKNLNLLNTSKVKSMRGMFEHSALEVLDLSNFNTVNVTDMAGMFNALRNVKSLDLSSFNTSNVTDMSSMFFNAGENNTQFTLNLGNNFNTINVTNMRNMFCNTGHKNPQFTLNLGNKFDTRNVTDMSDMFNQTGYSSTVFKLDLGDKFDTSKVTNMSSMFIENGFNSPVFTLDLGDKFDTSNVTNMNSMFFHVGIINTSFTNDLGNKFDTSNVVDMSCMFCEMGRASTIFELDLGDKFDTSSAKYTNCMFSFVGFSNPNFTFDLGDKFDTSNVIYMNHMFDNMGYNSTVFTLDLGDKFDTKNVTHMYDMFYNTGRNSTVFTLDLGDKFNTSNVIYISRMFEFTGYKSTVFKLDCSSWNVDNVTSHDDFNYAVQDKVTPPQWKK